MSKEQMARKATGKLVVTIYVHTVKPSHRLYSLGIRRIIVVAIPFTDWSAWRLTYWTSDKEGHFACFNNSTPKGHVVVNGDGKVNDKKFTER